MGALDAVEWEVCSLEPVRNPAAERMLRSTFGAVPPSARYFLDCRWVTGAYAALATLPVHQLSPDLTEMIALVVSQDNSCRYCYTATRATMKILGFPEARIRRLEENFLGADLSPADTAALAFARCVSRATPLACAADAQPLLAAGYSISAAKEVVVFAANSVFFNRLSTMPALPPHEMDFADRWWARLLRPLIASRMRTPRARQSVSLQPEQREGVFAEFVNALDGLSTAPRLRAVLDDAWQPSTLSQRLKGLVFAVVARGITCTPAEREATRLLVAEGMVIGEVEQALAHLSGPAVDPLEQSVLTLARESIWYRPAQLQHHARAVRAQCTREQFVEVIALTALANAVCRLSVAVDLARQ